MKDKEERILVTKLCGRNCPVLSNDNICVLDYDCEECHAGISRTEAVERMAKAACKANRRCIGGVCETCTSDMPKGYIHSSEAALDALLGGKNG